MKPVTVTLAGAATSPAVPLDYIVTPFQVSIGVNVVSGTVAYKLQYTYDDPDTATVWFDHPIMVGKTGPFDCVINAAPVLAVRLVNTDTGTLRARIVQGGP